MPAIGLQLDPENYPFTAYGEFGREHYPNVLAWLQRNIGIQTYVHGPIGLQDIEIDAKDDTVCHACLRICVGALHPERSVGLPL